MKLAKVAVELLEPRHRRREARFSFAVRECLVSLVSRVAIIIMIERSGTTDLRGATVIPSVLDKFPAPAVHLRIIDAISAICAVFSETRN